MISSLQVEGVDSSSNMQIIRFETRSQGVINLFQT